LEGEEMGLQRLRGPSGFIFILIILFISMFPLNGFSGAIKEEEAVVTTRKPVYGGTYNRGLGHDPVTLDPSNISDIYEEVVRQQIFEGLVQFSDNLMVIPCLAESWESSRNNLRWVFHLKKGATFHNGREIVADDFVYTFTRILNPKTGSNASPLLQKIKGVVEFQEGRTESVEGLKAIDKYTLEIRLAEIHPQFIAVLAMVNLCVVPREEIERSGKNFGLHPVGTGPFCFDYWKRNEEIVLKANEDYHEGRPYLDQIIFKIFSGSSADEMFLSFEQCKLDDSLVPAVRHDEILQNERYQLLKRPSLSIRMLVMNNNYEFLKDRRLRQALNYAIDKETISAEAGKGRLIPATGFIPQGMAGYQPDNINYPYSPEKARELLKEAGYPGGSGLPVLQLWSSVKSKGLLIEDEAIKRYLSAIGVKLNTNYLTDWPAFKRMLEEGKAPMFKSSWAADIPDPDNILSSLFYSKSPYNRSFYRNPKVDALIEKAQNESNYKKRISLYSSIQKMVMDDAPVILLNSLAYERVFQSYVRDFEGKAIGDHYFSLKRVWLDTQPEN